MEEIAKTEDLKALLEKMIIQLDSMKPHEITETQSHQ